MNKIQIENFIDVAKSLQLDFMITGDDSHLYVKIGSVSWSFHNHQLTMEGFVEMTLRLGKAYPEKI